MKQTQSSIMEHLMIFQSRLYATNSGVFFNDGEVCLVDPALFPEEIDGIAQWVREKNFSVPYLVITHGHWDHILGAEHFPGTAVVSNAAYLDQLDRYGYHLLTQVSDFDTQFQVQRKLDFSLPRPSLTFRDKKELSIGNFHLELIHAPGHDEDQLVVYDAQNSTLWAADMLSDIEIPFICHNLPDYESTLENLSRLKIDILVPGHGSVACHAEEIRSRFSADRQYLAELGGIIKDGITSGFSLEETIHACSVIPFRNPQENHEPHLKNVCRVYLSMGGEPDERYPVWGKPS